MLKKHTKNAVEIVTTKKMSKISENMTKILPSESLSNWNKKFVNQNLYIINYITRFTQSNLKALEKKNIYYKHFYITKRMFSYLRAIEVIRYNYRRVAANSVHEWWVAYMMWKVLHRSKRNNMALFCELSDTFCFLII